MNLSYSLTSFQKFIGTGIFILCVSLFFFTNCYMSEDPLDLTMSSSESPVPNLLAQIQQLATQNPDIFNQSCNSWDFIDIVVDNLRNHNERFGYNCEQGNCDIYSTNRVAFYTGSASMSDVADGSSEVIVVDVVDCSSSPQAIWIEGIRQSGLWKQNREGDTTTTTPYSINPLPETTQSSTSTSAPFTTNTGAGAGITSNFPHRNESAPNMKRIIDQLALQCPNIMQAVWDESRQSWSGDLRFLDLAVEALRAEDQRWGYTFWTRTGRPDSWSVDRVGYFHGIGNPNNSTDMTVIDYLAPRQENGRSVYYSDWYDATRQLKTEYPDATGYWRYPRSGATVSLSDCSRTSSVSSDNDVSDFSWDKVRWLNSHDVSGWSETSQITSVQVKQNGQVCIDHNKKGQWPPATPLGGDTLLEGNPYIIVKIGDTYYAATYEWLRPGQVCKLGHAGPLSVTYSGNDSIGAHTKRSPLQTWAPTGGEVVGFMVSGLARNQVTPNARERSNIVWYRLPSIDGSISGQEVGRTSGSNGSTTTTSVTSASNQLSECTQEQLNNGYGTHPQKGCVPRCITFARSNANGVEIAEGNNCNDIANYNILEIKKTFEDGRCCRRSSKRSCPMGYRFIRGNCQPTCAQAAGLAGYTQKAGHNRVGNYVLHEKQTFANDANCRELDEYGPNGYNDWKDFDFYDPYTFRNLRNDSNTIYEIIIDRNDDYLCCRRGTPNTAKGSSYDSNGWAE